MLAPYAAPTDYDVTLSIRKYLDLFIIVRFSTYVGWDMVGQKRSWLSGIKIWI